ncbi:hypothetical protein B0H16DRAFT_1478280 [Mycena metata]|uniref:Uncharacterized protein n=1 Tax=Mycena metata TaxID=1033252 RepID=A0AAD7H729_9AGAR|nr:hypothetical protein B0H16DRAFT_1478280 [Mycena metata]
MRGNARQCRGSRGIFSWPTNIQSRRSHTKLPPVEVANNLNDGGGFAAETTERQFQIPAPACTNFCRVVGLLTLFRSRILPFNLIAVFITFCVIQAVDLNAVGLLADTGGKRLLLCYSSFRFFYLQDSDSSLRLQHHRITPPPTTKGSSPVGSREHFPRKTTPLQQQGTLISPPPLLSRELLETQAMGWSLLDHGAGMGWGLVLVVSSPSLTVEDPLATRDALVSILATPRMSVLT